ncbi:uncharacterized protein LOC132743554 [Ruditapes philippinarum]|uniref:uncharacterized protein LOC132743554 n=1 Tax=Ruditapes philippinarum TaxID=129788 RepID=UPI00295B2E42|nr:uncharacterized protein LOC132743554 [Ruditapes philippinarum]
MLHESREDLFETKALRKRNLIQNLKSSKADVVCLQEVFFGIDLEDIVKGLRKQFPYSFSGLHDDVNDFPSQARGRRRPPCDHSKLDKFLTCARTTNCLTTPYKGELNNCVKVHCVQEISEIFKNDDSDCLNCLASSVNNMQKCSSPRPVQGGRAINKGGLVLLSKRKLSDATFNAYHPEAKLFRTNGYIKADIDDVATAFCTSLSDSYEWFLELDMIKNGTFSSYSEMNTHQTNTLITSVRDTKTAVILGDFNAGLRYVSGQYTKQAENYLRFLKRFPTMPAIQYTYRKQTRSSYSYVRDHVFVKNMLYRKTERVFLHEEDENVRISDHVGVQTLIEPPC